MSEDRQRVCTYFQKTGRCRYGDACRYSHSSPSLRQAAGFQERVWSHGQASTSQEHPLFANVRIMSYNILADQLAHEHAHELYRACPRWCLQWQHRGPAILAEIEHWAPNIGCLQEVDHLEEFHSFLQQLGYETAYAARTGDRCDGCLTFWRRGRFTALQSESLQMRSFGLKDNVALLVLLAPVAAGPQGLAPAVPHPSAPALLIGNTHLLFNPNRGDIKAGQARTILTRMRDIQSAAGRPSWSLLMGDFNSVPGSPIYCFVRSGSLDCSLVDRRNMSGQLNSKSSGWPPRNHQQGCGVPQQNGVTSHNHPPAEECVTGTPVGALPASGQSMAIGIPQQQLQALTHSSSFPSIVGGDPQMPHQASRAQSMRASAPPLYSHLDSNGRVFWSPLPPSGDDSQQSVAHHPFYYEPMLVEEAAPVLDAAARLAKSASVNARMSSMATWAKDQLDMAVGSRAAELDAASVGIGRRLKSGRHAPTSSGDSSSGSNLDMEAWVARHPLGTLYSAYAQVLGSEPGFTSCHGRVIATLDYMWYTRLLHMPSPAARPGPPPHRASADTVSLSQTTLTSWVAAAVAEIVESHPDASTAHNVESHVCVSDMLDCRKGGDLCESESQPDGQSGSQSEPTQSGNGAASEAESASATCSGVPGEPGSDEWELVPMRVAMVPPLRSLRCGLPAPEFPSDHISLVTEFSVRSLRPAPGVPVPGVVVPGAIAVMSAATAATAQNSVQDQPLRHIYFDD
ncbi:probable protein angel homolog 2 at N-terminal half [Coccomyxa sp. Obi]|nr:probable protein angel homolog 2 at N-terminal half [Coccomyxa sp. Obi]